MTRRESIGHELGKVHISSEVVPSYGKGTYYIDEIGRDRKEKDHEKDPGNDYV